MKNCRDHNKGELPWDGAAAARFRCHGRLPFPAHRTFLSVMILTALAFVLPYCSKAQSRAQHSDTAESKCVKTLVLHDEESRCLIQGCLDYLDILKQLQSLTNDYRDCIMAAPVVQSGDCLKNLNLISARLQKGIYLEQIDRLSTDIGVLQQSLETAENTLRETDKRAFRLCQSFHEELGALKLLFQQDVAPRLAGKQKLLELVEAALKAANLAAVAASDNVDSAYSVSVSVAETPVAIVESLLLTPQVAALPKTWTAQDTASLHMLGGSKIVRKFVDSMSVSSTSQPIYINNPIGDLEVTGWKRNNVLAVSRIELSADSPKKASQQAQLIALRISSKDNGIYVELLVPSLTEPRTKVGKSILKVKVPQLNPLVCANSFGKVMIKRIRNNVKLTASNSQVEVDDVKGSIEVANSLGKVSLVRISGPIKVTNSYRPIDITRCQGDMEIENAFSTIALTHTEGTVIIHNTGGVDIKRHSGSIQIENRNGTVEVTKLDGDLSVQNSFQSLLLEDIFGSAEVTNANGKIEAKNVTGAFSASNSFGRIYGDQLYGPIHLTSKSSTIDITLPERLAGPSTIEVSYGTVVVTVPPHSDLLLTTTTVGGSIESPFPMEIKDVGLTKTAEITLGNAKVPLTISGNNATIIIRKKK